MRVSVLLLLAFLAAFVSPSAATAQASQVASPLAVSAFQNPSGLQKTLLLLVQFSDLEASTPASAFAGRLDFLDRYFREVSYSSISVTGEVSQSWLTLARPLSYYGRDKSRPGDDEGGNREGSLQLIIDAVRGFDPQFNFAQFSHVIVVHAGRDQAESSPLRLSDDIWSQTVWGFSPISTRDGVSIRKASIVAGNSPVGTFAHEFAHQIGFLPDLYDKLNPQNHFVGPWSLMDSGAALGTPKGSAPSHLDSWSKIKLGWLKPAVALEKSGEFLIAPLASSEGTRAVQIPLSGGVYYLVEVRRRIGFDSALPNEGVLIYLVDESKESGEGPVRVMSADPQGLDKAAFRVGQVFSDKVNKVFVRVVAQVDGSFRVQITAELQVVISISLSRSISVFQFSSALVEVEPAVQGLQLDLYLDDQLFKTFPTTGEGRYEAPFLFDFAQIGQHRLRVELVDRAEGKTLRVVEREFEVVVHPYLYLASAGAVVAILVWSMMHTARRRRTSSTPLDGSLPATS